MYVWSGPLVEGFRNNGWVDLWRLGVQEAVKPPHRVAREYRLDTLIETGLMAIPDACFEFVGCRNEQTKRSTFLAAFRGS